MAEKVEKVPTVSGRKQNLLWQVLEKSFSFFASHADFLEDIPEKDTPQEETDAETPTNRSKVGLKVCSPLPKNYRKKSRESCKTWLQKLKTRSTYVV